MTGSEDSKSVAVSGCQPRGDMKVESWASSLSSFVCCKPRVGLSVLNSLHEEWEGQGRGERGHLREA